jgi:hypothetical protein
MSTEAIEPGEPPDGQPRMVLIEAPGWGDAEFYAAWLSSATKAKSLLDAIRKSDPELQERLEDYEVLYPWDFALAGALLVSHLGPEFPTLAIDLSEECFYADMFCIMAELGFYELTGDRYQMTLPATLDVATVRDAVLKLAETMDEDEVVHPERLVLSISRREAKDWHRRLSELSEMARLTDRGILLGR